MSDNKLIKIFKLALIGPILFWITYISSGGRWSSLVGPDGESPFLIIFSGTAGLYFISAIIVSCFIYTKKERKLDNAISGNSDVDLESVSLLGAIQHQLDPVEEGVEYSIVDSQHILRTEIMKARRSGASNKDIAEYLQHQLDDWIEDTRFIHSDFESYTQIIDELNE